MKTKPLYKRTAGGKVQQWCMEVDGDKYRTISGLVGGKQVVSAWTVAVTKNAARANATTAEQQAVAEVQSQYTKKVKAGYTETTDAAVTDQRFQVMLAKHYKDYKEKHLVPLLVSGEIVWSQSKLDGVRCYATRHGLFSRKNTPILSCPHIFEALAPVFEAYPDAVLDGELYNHELHDDFDELVSVIRKTTGITPQDLEKSAAFVQYHVYDAAGRWDQDIGVLNFLERKNRVADTLQDLAEPCLCIVPTVACYDTGKLDMLYELYLSEGYEGQIVRIDAEYQQGARTKDLLKRKEFQDAEFKVRDICPGVGNRAGMAGYAVLELPDGRAFNSNVKGGVDFYRELLANKAKYIGGEATVLFANYTPKGVPRFPRIPKDKWWPQGRDL